MKCDDFLPALETGGLVQRLKARCHAARCRRCASQRAAFADAMQRWAVAEPLSPRAESLWRQAAGAAAARPGRGNAWKLATAGAIAAACLAVACLLAVSWHIHNSPIAGPQRIAAGNEIRRLGPVTVEEIDPSEGSAYLADEVRRLQVELKSLQQAIEKKSAQRQIAAALKRFGEPPSPAPE
jgi:hypothetical protein